MRNLLFLPPVLLLGLFIGGWSPNEELRTLRKEVADLNGKLASREKDSRLDAITRMVRIPDRAAAKPPPPPSASAAETVREQAPPASPSPAADAAQPAPAAEPPPAPPPEEPPVAPEDLRARIEEAKELWATRVQIAREQWLNRLRLTAEGAALFDATIDAMNAEMLASMQGLADALAADGEMTPELGTRFFNEMTASLVRTYDDLDAFVPAEQRGEAARIELTDFIDPAVAEPLIDVQNKLENLPRPGGDRRSWRNRR
jgi:hypothetical protein